LRAAASIGEIVLNKRNKESYENKPSAEVAPSKFVKLGLISVSSALVGGLAAAWWYRKTLIKLQNPIIEDDIQKSESSGAREDESFI
jgi:hypothetical protein